MENSNVQAGILTLTFTGECFTITGVGQIWTVKVTSCKTATETLPANIALAALRDLVVELPNGKIGIVKSIESFLQGRIGVGRTIGDLGLLVEPLDTQL